MSNKTYFIGIFPLFLINKWTQRVSSNVVSITNDDSIGAGIDRTSLTSNAIIQILLQFGGGVLFATVFTHLLPEIKENYENYIKSNVSLFKTNDETHEKSSEIPIVEIAICLGFFLIFFIEELMHFFLNRFNKHQNKHNNCYNRDLMYRCSSICSHLNNEELSLPNETKPFSRNTFVNYGADLSIETSIRNVKPNILSNEILTVCDTTNNSCTSTSVLQINNNYNNNNNNIETEKLNNEPSIVLFIRGLVIILSFSVHSIFDGLAIGLQTSSSELWFMFFAISVHKLVIAFVVSLQLFEQSHRLFLVAIHMAIFAIMSPIGILIVIISEESLVGENSESNPIVILLTSIATGTLLYIIFYEILQKDRRENINGFLQLFSILFGFGVMLTINVMISE
ncbi:zinc transporter ZIP3-like [Oppia nitens]|uniref:zinc transporter ZIP3-like n=1 Tax=Oppia nitens TaxID=1686743 RepID=UPI0023DCA2F1|nr:zinc transporter ZIP3-like [Oppia nitens]